MVKPALLEVSGVPATVIWTEKENKATQKEIEREFSQSQFTLAPRRCNPYQRIQSSSVVKLVGHHSCGADRLPVAVRFPAGPRVRLKTVDPPKSNGLGQKKNFTRGFSVKQKSKIRPSMTRTSLVDASVQGEAVSILGVDHIAALCALLFLLLLVWFLVILLCFVFVFFPFHCMVTA